MNAVIQDVLGKSVAAASYYRRRVSKYLWVKIPYLQPSSEQEIDLILADIKDLSLKSQFILGKPVEKFEKAFSKIAGCHHAVGVGSGTDALILSLKALGIGAGDEVITTANSYVATAGAIALTGARPVFVDVGDDYNMDSALIERVINKKTKAILPIHLGGMPCNMELILEIARHFKIAVVEDGAQSVSAELKSKPVGSFGTLACFSLHPLKEPHIWGDGGVITTHSPETYRLLKRFRNHGMNPHEESEFFSGSSRLDAIQAVVALHSLGSIDRVISQRRRNASIYFKRLNHLAHSLTLPRKGSTDVRPTFSSFMIKVRDRNALSAYLKQNGIETETHYPKPVHLQKAARYLGYEKGDLPVTESLVASLLYLPIRHTLNENQIHEVCDRIERFYSKARYV